MYLFIFFQSKALYDPSKHSRGGGFVGKTGSICLGPNFNLSPVQFFTSYNRNSYPPPILSVCVGGGGTVKTVILLQTINAVHSVNPEKIQVFTVFTQKYSVSDSAEANMTYFMKCHSCAVALLCVCVCTLVREREREEREREEKRERERECA